MESAMTRFKHCAILIVATLAGTAAAPAAEDPTQSQIRAALLQWAADFNAGSAEKVCALFAPDLRATVRGRAERGYEEQCELLKRSLGDRTKRYSYALDIQEILVWGDVAVVRLVWTLTVQPEGAPAQTSVEPGMDIFRREGDGRWRIMRYMAYEQ
jgi:steroid delta-isomerase